MPMKTFASREVQSRFGVVIDTAKREPVTLTQYGKEVVMMVPMEIGREAVRLFNAQRFSSFLRELPPPNPDAEALTVEDINRLVHELRP